VIAHELAHHAAGHTAFWRNLLIKPAFFIPFLGAAYSRACELTADRVAAAWLRDPAASKSALILLASGSLRFRKQVDLQAFREQERLVPPFFGWLFPCSGVMGSHQATNAPTSAPRRAFPLRRALWVNWKKAR